MVLKNGDRLTGTAVKLDGGKLTFKTAYADPIAIAWDQVANLKVDKPLVLPQEMCIRDSPPTYAPHQGFAA